MKILVGFACVALIAFVGYFFWGEWQKADAPRQAEIAFLHDCHRSGGEFTKRRETSLMIGRDFPELVADMQGCLDRLGQDWGVTQDPELLALQAEGAARVN